MLLVGILRGDHEERLGEPEAFGIDRHLPLRHGFQKCALGAGRGPIDLVGKEDVGEDRPAAEFKLPIFLVEDVEAGDVARQKVRRALDAGEPTADRVGERLGERCLAEAGPVLQEQMPAGQQTDEHVLDDVPLPLEHIVEPVPNRFHAVEGGWPVMAYGNCHESSLVWWLTACGRVGNRFWEVADVRRFQDQIRPAERQASCVFLPGKTGE